MCETKRIGTTWWITSRDSKAAHRKNCKLRSREYCDHLRARLARQSFGYAIPQRMSLANLEHIVSSFLHVPSGGLRPLAVATALFKTLAEGFSLFTNVESQGVNEADAAAGMPGDIMCYLEDEIRLVVEVKDINLTLAHVRASSRKAKQSGDGLSNLLFRSPGDQGSR